ncbi:cell division protein ZapA [Sedimenticola selenatireducens]|uniref:Cell division protein ZapA n=1 Tax=Sedimenticola selenatireducens TaxID=191960 RepID=A0A2N6CTP2_9GAMM|nr:cell division protein ZapA [Sedimenticola selenatireducens]PLX60537.1 MAG: cell division protein ZapA [Sedimenticola selenatireducens]
MIENSIPVIVRILDKEYRVACNQGEEDSLIAAARLVDQKMREIRSSGKVLGTDRIAVMASLNLAHELLEKQNHKDDVNGSINTRLRNMQQKIDAALSKENRLDL